MTALVAGEVERWLHNLKKKPHRKRKPPFPEFDAKKAKPLAPGAKAKIRSLMQEKRRAQLRIVKGLRKQPAEKNRGSGKEGSAPKLAVVKSA